MIRGLAISLKETLHLCTIILTTFLYCFGPKSAACEPTDGEMHHSCRELFKHEKIKDLFF